METLAERIARGPVSELDAIGWAIRLAKRLEALHALGVAHGSVSPACVITAGEDRNAKAFLADVQRTVSPRAYQSPERVLGGSLSTADDVWALGATLYALLTGQSPFGGSNDDEVRQKILASSPPPLAVFDVGDDDLQHILDRAFAREAVARTPSVAVFRRSLEEWHPDPGVQSLAPLEDEDSLNDDDEGARTGQAQGRAYPFPASSLSGGSSSGSGGGPNRHAAHPPNVPQAPHASHASHAGPAGFGGPFGPPSPQHAPPRGAAALMGAGSPASPASSGTPGMQRPLMSPAYPYAPPMPAQPMYPAPPVPHPAHPAHPAHQAPPVLAGAAMPGGAGSVDRAAMMRDADDDDEDARTVMRDLAPIAPVGPAAAPRAPGTLAMPNPAFSGAQPFARPVPPAPPPPSAHVPAPAPASRDIADEDSGDEAATVMRSPEAMAEALAAHAQRMGGGPPAPLGPPPAPPAPFASPATVALPSAYGGVSPATPAGYQPVSRTAPMQSVEGDPYAPAFPSVGPSGPGGPPSAQGNLPAGADPYAPGLNPMTPAGAPMAGAPGGPPVAVMAPGFQMVAQPAIGPDGMPITNLPPGHATVAMSEQMPPGFPVQMAPVPPREEGWSIGKLALAAVIALVLTAGITFALLRMRGM